MTSPLNLIFKAKKTQKETCLYSRNIMTLLDLPETTKNYKSLQNHVDHCELCQKEMIEAQHNLRLVDQKIPNAFLEDSTRETLFNEVKEVFSRIDFENREFVLSKKKNFWDNFFSWAN